MRLLHTSDWHLGRSLHGHDLGAAQAAHVDHLVEVVRAEQVDAIAKLPSRDVLYGRLVGMVASPLTGLASAMGGLIGGLARQLQQMADEGLVGGDAPANTSAQTETQED